VGYNRTAKSWQQEWRPEARVPTEKPADEEGAAREAAERGGFEALERLKSDPATHDIPVIIITSKTLGYEERQLLDGKVVALLSKETASHEAVIAGVRRALAEAGSVPERPEGAPQHG
jgi:response regulator RpfG family c-di-GMP phosphodiesterase